MALAESKGYIHTAKPPLSLKAQFWFIAQIQFLCVAVHIIFFKCGKYPSVCLSVW